MLITTSTSSAHNGVHLISVKLSQLLLLYNFFYGQIVTCLLLISYVCYIISDRLNMFGIYYIFVDTKLCTEEMHSHVFVYTFKVNITSFVVCIVIF